MSNELSDRYDAGDVEQRTYQWWESKGYFKAEDVSTKPPYSIILPPPNVTGSLHLGHALDHTIQDVLIRWKRMSGFNTLWLPGTDHAGIATQTVVEKMLMKENKQTRHDLGREAFIEKVWDWKHQYGNRIYEQMRHLGDSCDWDRSVFTLDEGVSKAVKKVFVDLYNRGLIYRGTRLINWSSKLETALSDIEVEYQDVKGSLWHIDYPLPDGDKLTIATTRPETMLADSAICVHPKDERYAKYIGREISLPLTDRKIPIIGDEYVDREFGSGVLKVTPAHDFNDYEIGQRHNLPMMNILNKNGTLNENAGKYQGLTVKKAREAVVADLEELGLLNKIEPHMNSVGHCSRSGCVAEPFLSEQWFVKMQDLATPARHVVENGTITFEPEVWTKTYLHWMNNIQDWCVSRQLWWGHRIPAWYSEDGELLVSEGDANEERPDKKWTQDPDVLDTWFSSALWPFTTMGWPEDTETQKTFFPTNVLVTGHDIIFFWVARMIMMGLEHKGDVPFRKVIIHGLIRDSQGKKMSKSIGNAVDPMELIEKYGADSLRFTLMSQVASGKDLKFSEQRLEGYRNFMNKIWNATRFSLQVLEGLSPEDAQKTPVSSHLSLYDQWIVWKLGKVMDQVETAMQAHRFSDAANALYAFMWHDFCDWYVELSKPIVRGEQEDEKRATQQVMVQTLNRVLRLLHPFVPFITEELYQKLPLRGDAIIVDHYPTTEKDKEWLSLGSEVAGMETELVKEVIAAIRNIRGENRIKPGEKITVRLMPSDDRAQKILGENKSSITTLGRVGQLDITDQGEMSKCAVTPVVSGSSQVQVVIPLEGLVDIEEEVQRLEKTLEKLEKERGGLKKRLENKNFVDGAPSEVVQQVRDQLESLDSKRQSLTDSLDRLR